MTKLIVQEKFKDAFTRITYYVEKFKNEKNIEFEFRLGFIDDGKFDTDVPIEFFNKIMSKLQSNKNWEHVEKRNTVDYFHSGYRIGVTNGNTECIKKSKLVTIDFKFEETPFDIRFCISKEEPCKLNDIDKKIKSSEHKREKNRTRFKHKHWYFDMTQVKEVENTIGNVTHEVELDVNLGNSETAIEYVVYSSLLKLNDLVNMCESVPETSKVTFSRIVNR